MTPAELRKLKEAWEEAKRALARSDKELAQFVPEERERRRAALVQAVSTAERRVREGRDALMRETQADLAPVDDRTLLDALSRDDLQRATLLAPFVREDFDDLDPTDLAGRIAGVAAGSDRVLKLLYLRHGRRRAATTGENAGAVAEALTTLEETLSDQAARRAAEAKRAEASKVLGAFEAEAYLYRKHFTTSRAGSAH